MHLSASGLEFERRQTWPSDILNFLLLVFDSSPEWFDLRKEYNHKCHMLVDPFIERSFVSESEPDIFNLYLKVFIFASKSIDFVAESKILH